MTFTKYFGIKYLEEFVEKEKIPENMDPKNNILISSVIDILYYNEKLKLTHTPDSDFCNKIKKLTELGVHFQGLGKFELEENLFQLTVNDEFCLSEFTNNTSVSPYFSANKVSLKPTVRSYWDDSFFEEILF